MTGLDGENKREHSRAPIELKVVYKKINSFFADYTKNISRGGTFIATQKPLALGTAFVFALEVPGLPETLRLNGLVIWVVKAQQANEVSPAGMGIEFQYRDEDERKSSEAVVEKLMQSELGHELTPRLLGKN